MVLWSLLYNTINGDRRIDLISSILFSLCSSKVSNGQDRSTNRVLTLLVNVFMNSTYSDDALWPAAIQYEVNINIIVYNLVRKHNEKTMPIFQDKCYLYQRYVCRSIYTENMPWLAVSISCSCAALKHATWNYALSIHGTWNGRLQNK